VKPYQVILTIVAAAAIATLGLLEGGGATLPEAMADHPLDEHFDPLMPRYPRASEFPLGGQLDIGQGQMKMSHFSTTDPPLRIARYYQTIWEGEGLSVHQDVSPSGGIVGTYDPRAKLARSVTIVTHGGLTWVFPATVDRPLGVAKAGELVQEAGLPEFPGSSSGLSLRTTDSGKASLVTTSTNSGGLEKNLHFYREEMSSRGWTEVDVPQFEKQLGQHRALAFERGAGRCSINLTPVGDEDQVIVCILFEGGDDER
jgi:hypothetical protein